MCGWTDFSILGRLLAGVPDHFVGHGLFDAAVPSPAGKQPRMGLVFEAAPVLAQFLQQFGAEHDVAVLAAFAAEDMDHHAFGVDVGDLEPGEFGAAEPGGIQGHQHGAV